MAHKLDYPSREFFLKKPTLGTQNGHDLTPLENPPTGENNPNPQATIPLQPDNHTSMQHPAPSANQGYTLHNNYNKLENSESSYAYVLGKDVMQNVPSTADNPSNGYHQTGKTDMQNDNTGHHPLDNNPKHQIIPPQDTPSKRPRQESESSKGNESEDSDGYELSRREKRRIKKHRSKCSPHKLIQNINKSPELMEYVQTTSKHYPSFIINILAPWKNETEMLVALIKTHRDLLFIRKKTNKGFHILTPTNQYTLDKLDNLQTIDGKPFSVTKLKPRSPKLTGVIYNIPPFLPLDMIQEENPVVVHAKRNMRWDHKSRKHVQTRSVTIILETDKLPPSIHIRAIGTIPVKPHFPEPVRCYRCQRFGHVSKACHGDYYCGICAGKHSTKTCLEKDRNNIIVKCINCKENHTTASLSCSTRKEACQAIRANVCRINGIPYTPPEPKDKQVASANTSTPHLGGAHEQKKHYPDTNRNNNRSTQGNKAKSINLGDDCTPTLGADHQAHIQAHTTQASYPEIKATPTKCQPIHTRSVATTPRKQKNTGQTTTLESKNNTSLQGNKQQKYIRYDLNTTEHNVELLLSEERDNSSHRKARQTYSTQQTPRKTTTNKQTKSINTQTANYEHDLISGTDRRKDPLIKEILDAIKRAPEIKDIPPAINSLINTIINLVERAVHNGSL